MKTGDNRIRNCIEGIRDYHANEINLNELKTLRAEDYGAADADTTACASYFSVYAAADAGFCKSKEDKWQEIEQLFIKHFGE